jgi:ribosomal protein L33
MTPKIVRSNYLNLLKKLIPYHLDIKKFNKKVKELTGFKESLKFSYGYY